MPLQITTPIEHNGNTYPYCTVNLAISPLEKQDGIGGSVSMLLVPYRELEGGGIEKVEDQAKSVVFLDVFEHIQNGDAALGAAVTQIMGAIQNFITDKNL
jgi:hypothetical protein